MKLVNKSNSQVLFQEVIRAESYFSRMMGLMGKKDFPQTTAMWFTKCNAIQTCFMRFAIDFVFVDSTGKVVKIYHDVKPWRMTSFVKNATDAIEMVSGLAKAKNLNEGDILECGP